MSLVERARDAKTLADNLENKQRLVDCNPTPFKSHCSNRNDSFSVRFQLKGYNYHTVFHVPDMPTAISYELLLNTLWQSSLQQVIDAATLQLSEQLATQETETT